MTDAGTRFFYDFGEFRLDPQQRLLSVTADGRPVPLVPKAFEMLLHLIERRGELLSKASLMKAVWPSLVVEENSLNQTISAIRRSLGERPGEHRFIVTEPGRGYRFVADITVTSSQPKAAERLAAPPAGHNPARTSIAVLPFANLTDDAGKDYFSDGMAEELIHTLARISGLRVPSRTSSFAYKGRNVDVRQIARDLDVATVLEGSVRSAGERIRVTAQLIDGVNGFHLWSQHYDRDFGDLFKLQDELAHAIVQALRLRLDTQSPDKPLRQPPTRDLEAYHLYLQALMQQGRAPFETSVPRAATLLQAAIERDPSFVEAHVGLAAVRAIAVTMNVSLAGSLADLERDILRILEGDPTRAGIRVALGVIYAAQGRWLASYEQFRQGLADDESEPATLATYGLNLLGTVGYAARYLEASQNAHRLAPGWIIAMLNVAVASTITGDDDAVRRYTELALGMGYGAHLAPLNDVLTQHALRAGRYEEAIELAISALPPAIASDGGAETVRRYVAALRDGSPGGALLPELDRLRDRIIGASQPQIHRRRFMVWYTQLGALDKAFELLNQSLDDFGRSATIGSAWAFLWMPELKPLRRDPRFQLICRRMGLFEFWQVHGAPDHCELRAGQLIVN